MMRRHGRGQRLILPILSLVAYAALGGAAVYFVWRWTARFRKLPMRLALASLVFAVFFTPMRLGISNFFIPRAYLLLVFYVSRAVDPRSAEYFPFDGLRFYFIPLLITWLAAFLLALIWNIGDVRAVPPRAKDDR